MQLRVYNLSDKSNLGNKSRANQSTGSDRPSSLQVPELRDLTLAPAILATELYPGTQHDVCFIPLPPERTAAQKIPTSGASAQPPLELAVSMCFSKPTRYAELGWSRVSRAASALETVSARGDVVYGQSAPAADGLLLLGESGGAVVTPLSIYVDRMFAGQIAPGIALAPDGSISKNINMDVLRLNAISAVSPDYWTPALSNAKVSPFPRLCLSARTLTHTVIQYILILSACDL